MIIEKRHVSKRSGEKCGIFRTTSRTTRNQEVLRVQNNENRLVNRILRLEDIGC